MFKFWSVCRLWSGRLTVGYKSEIPSTPKYPHRVFLFFPSNLNKKPIRPSLRYPLPTVSIQQLSFGIMICFVICFTNYADTAPQILTIIEFMVEPKTVWFIYHASLFAHP
jgi:hypothetical protein